MLSTESWDNCEKPSLLFPFTALTCDETPVFSGSVLNLVAHSVDKYGVGSIFRQPVTIAEVMIWVTNYSVLLLNNYM